ncbi:MAG: hypothetical protein A2878_00190 [Candidatus Moranbacteria bacterium RIFCSPHIGHO2_01_FULL_54_31]|nr:MAG: hypothetical protein A2878_00190 [Candidatus Moranbacteria bacterium RIFCSPHIGHO2_01_FULL_54_31]
MLPPASWARAFLVTLFFVTLASGLFWLDFFRSYQAEVTVLVVSKTGTVQSSGDVAGNVAEIARTLSFYERVLADNDLIDDAFEGYAPDARKKAWNDSVSVKRQDQSGTLVIQAHGETPEMAKRLAKQTAQSLFSVAGLYYNVKTDIDMRIIDGPIASYVLARPFLFGVTSLLSGLLVTALFFLLLNLVPGFMSRKSGKLYLSEARTKAPSFFDAYAAPEKAYPEFSLGETVPWIDPKKFIPAKSPKLSFKGFEAPVPAPEEIYVPYPGTHSIAHAPAPANLPVADESQFLGDDEVPLPAVPEFGIPAEEPKALFPPTQGEPAASEAYRGEPTAEEYKRRLNELLSGSN